MRSDRPTDTVQRTAMIAATVFVLGGVLWMFVESEPPRVRSDAGAAPLTTTTAVAPSLATPDASASEALDAGVELTLPALLLDASTVPSTAPRQVHLGVVLVAFAGAEGAAPNARSKKDAAALAERLATEAKTDFQGAVRAGDAGSSADMGHLPRGVLDPQTEVPVFSLAPGEVSAAIETPRGYWIVKRLD